MPAPLTAEAIRAAVRSGAPVTMARTAWICGEHRRLGVNEACAAALALAEAEIAGWHVSDTGSGIRLTPPGQSAPETTKPAQSHSGEDSAGLVPAVCCES